MHHRKGKKRVEASRAAFPADHQAAVLALEPRQCPFDLDARDVLFHGAPTPLVGLPHPLRKLGSHPTLPESIAKLFGGIPLIRRQYREPFARSAPLACADVPRIQQREDLASRGLCCKN